MVSASLVIMEAIVCCCWEAMCAKGAPSSGLRTPRPAAGALTGRTALAGDDPALRPGGAAKTSKGPAPGC